MTTLIVFQLALGLVALLVVGVVAVLYRGRQMAESGRVPAAPMHKLSATLAAVADKVLPGDAPPLGVLSSPEKSRAMSARFERAETSVRRLVGTAPRP